MREDWEVRLWMANLVWYVVHEGCFDNLGIVPKIH